MNAVDEWKDDLCFSCTKKRDMLPGVTGGRGEGAELLRVTEDTHKFRR